jgi:RimJ/RimL family protein N-acetyltransferase
VFDLRPVGLDDAGALGDLLSDPEVAAWLRRAGESGPFLRGEREAIVAQQAAHWTAHGFGTRLAWEDDRCIGWSLLEHCLVAGRSEVEIGWTVARDCWGQGIATELGRHALAAARALGLERVVAFTRHDNHASRRVMDKLGLSYELDFQHTGLPHVLYRWSA